MRRLKNLQKLKIGKLEKIEGIELLRALKTIYPSELLSLKSTSFSVDINDDLLKAINEMPKNPIRKNISANKKKIFYLILTGF